MDESDDNSGFSFGSVADTQYENVVSAQGIKLPYNPFVFDLTLRMIRTAPNYQSPGLQVVLENKAKLTHIFGRKPKKHRQQKQKEEGQQIIYHDFMAQTMSKDHFSINQNHILQDLGSKKGTFLWIHRNQPRKLKLNDQILINTIIFKVVTLNSEAKTLELSFDNKIMTLKKSQKLFLLGTNPKCSFGLPGFKQFQAAIDLVSMKFHNLIQDQDCSNDVGVWIKVRQKVQIQGQDIIMAYPYVFKLIY